MQFSRRSRRKHWIYPVFIILGVSILLYGVVYTVDHVVAKGSVGGGYFNFADDRITDAVGGLSGLFAAILGIVITVVSIVVQLTAERYTPRRRRCSSATGRTSACSASTSSLHLRRA